MAREVVQIDHAEGHSYRITCCWRLGRGLQVCLIELTSYDEHTREATGLDIENLRGDYVIVWAGGFLVTVKIHHTTVAVEASDALDESSEGLSMLLICQAKLVWRLCVWRL